jgi:hypothetical protein
MKRNTVIVACIAISLAIAGLLLEPARGQRGTAPPKDLCGLCPCVTPPYAVGVGDCHANEGVGFTREGVLWQIGYRVVDASNGLCEPLAHGVPDWASSTIRRILPGAVVEITYAGTLADGTPTLTRAAGFDVSNTGGPYGWEADVVWDNGYVGTLTYSHAGGINAPDHHPYVIHVEDLAGQRIDGIPVARGFRVIATMMGEAIPLAWKTPPPIMRGAARLLGIARVRISQPLDVDAFVPVDAE